MSAEAQGKDRKLVDQGRKKPLEGVAVDLRDQVIEKLVKRLEKLGEGRTTAEKWRVGNMRRADWLKRQEKLLYEYDEFLQPIRDVPEDWCSNLHLPVTYTVAKTVHARMLAALMDIDPPFSMKSRTAANEERVQMLTDLMRYALRDWSNYYQGVDAEVDEWLWRWVVGGSAILKGRWDRRYSRFVDVVRVPELTQVQELNPETGELELQTIQAFREREEEVISKDFEGPCLHAVATEDVLIIGGKGDPQTSDEVIEKIQYTAGDLWSLVDQVIFRKSAVEKVIEYGESLLLGSDTGAIKAVQATAAGVAEGDSTIDAPRYSILERHARIDVDDSGIPTDVIMWVHEETGEILRATYARRLNKSGLRPYFKIDFHKRHGQESGVGLAELMYTLAKELDAIHNMKIDFGLLSSMPWGFYRATATLTEERMPIEPGKLIPTDDPQADVHFPNLGPRQAFAGQEEQFLFGQIERLTSISDVNLGSIGGQGVTRTATGARALLGESNANLNVPLRRMNRGWKQALTYVFQMLQEKMPPGFEFRLTGSDGKTYFRRIASREELKGMYDFELEANSANSNQAVKEQVAMETYQITSNPLDLQLGLISPLERYESLKNVLQVKGIRDYSRFIRKPDGINRAYTPDEIVNRVVRGIDVPLTPDQDLQGFLAYFEEVIGDDLLLGQFTEDQTIALARKAQEAQALLAALQQQQAQQANISQQQMNSGMAQSDGALVPFNSPTGGIISGPEQ
jgi:hypothetical protein